MLERLSLKQKFLALESVSLGMLLTTVIFGLWILNVATETEKSTVKGLHTKIQLVEHINEMEEIVLLSAKTMKEVWLYGTDEGKRERYRSEIVNAGKKFEGSYGHALDELAYLQRNHPEMPDYAGRIRQFEDEFKTVRAKYLKAIDGYRGDALAADAVIAGSDLAVMREIERVRDEIVAFTDQKAAEKIELAQQRLKQRQWMVAIWTLVAVLLSFSLVKLFSGQVLRQLGGDPQEVATVVNQMATGDFSQKAPPSLAPGSLLANAYQMQDKLRGMIAAVKQQSVQVGDMAHSLAASAGQISANVNHESAAVANMATAIEELSASTTRISDQGAGAKQIANDSRKNAEQGAEVVNKTVSGLLTSADEIKSAAAEVSRLGEDASRISDVVKVIKEIADQTNLLALNAAIEAARAGEQGRGFAVVADEVRKLAERTAGATNEINQMSSKIGAVADHALGGMDRVVKTTQQGVGDAESAQESIRHIQQSFGQVAGVIDEIAAQLAEQNAAARELTRSTEQVSHMSEENSSAAQDLLQLANQLEGRAREVRQAVEVFRV